jgi:hypothetical protein
MIFPNEKGLRELIKESSAHAVLTMFWSGPPGFKAPITPDQLRELGERLQSIPVEVETDFDTDAEPPSATSKSPIQA